jgi:PAS domain S-box-containing protein
VGAAEWLSGGGERGPRFASTTLRLAWLLALLSLCGWIGGIPWLRGFGIPAYPDWPLAALANMALATALLLIGHGHERARSAFLIVAAMIGASALVEYILDASLGIDTALFHRSVTGFALPHPGRPGLIPTISILAVAIAAWLVARDRRRDDQIVILLASVLIGLAAMSIALLMLGTDLTRQSTRLAASLPASLTTLTLAGGLLAYLRERGRGALWSSRRLATGPARFALPIILVMPAILLPLEIRAGQIGLVSPLTAEIIASALNLLIVVGLLSWSIERISGQHEALLESQERLSLAMDAHGLGIFDWDVASGKLNWSPGAEQRLGLKPGTITDFTSWQALVEPDDVAAVMASIEAAVAQRADHFTFRYRFRQPNGIVRAIEGSSRLVYDADGNLVRSVGVNLDVTSRDEREAALRAGESQLRSILETVPDAMVIIDEQGLVRSFSTAAERIFGYGAADVVGENVSMLMPPARGAEHDGYLRHYLTTGERRVIGLTRKLIARRADGTEFPIELNVGEAWSGDARIFTGFIRDISDQVAAELRLEELRAEHAHSARLSAMGEMAAALAHELNQPLAAGANFLGTAELMLAEVENDRGAAEMIKLGNNQLQRAGEIIRRLRDFITKGDTELGVEPLQPMVREAAALGLIGSHQHDIRLTYDLSSKATHVIADRIQVQQVLVNLLRNSAEALRAVPVDLREIRVSSRVQSEELIEISVSDDGPGLPEEILSNLYAPFLSTKGSEGMGIGLSVCRRIVESHGGTLQAANKNGGGAIVSFTLMRFCREGENSA